MTFYSSNYQGIFFQFYSTKNCRARLFFVCHIFTGHLQRVNLSDIPIYHDLSCKWLITTIRSSHRLATSSAYRQKPTARAQVDSKLKCRRDQTICSFVNEINTYAAKLSSEDMWELCIWDTWHSHTHPEYQTETNKKINYGDKLLVHISDKIHRISCFVCENQLVSSCWLLSFLSTS